MSIISLGRSRATVLLLVSMAFLTSAAWSLRSADLRPDYQPPAYAVTGARIVTEPGVAIDAGTIVIRKGVIEAVGPTDKVSVPFDAETIDGKGLTVYPGFIDLYSTLGQAPGIVRSQTGSGRTVNYADFALASTPPDQRNGITPEFQVATVFDLADASAEERRGLGFTDLVSAPAGAIATGQSALVSLSGLPRRESLVRSPVALHINVKPPFEPAAPTPAADPLPVARRRGGGGGAGSPRYPTSLMGAIAHLRQAMLDAEYNHQLIAYYNDKGGERPPIDPALAALHAARTKSLPVWWEANSLDEIHSALDLAEEFGTTCVIVGGREAGKVADRLKALEVPVVLKVDFPDEPKVPTEAEYTKKEVIGREQPLKVLDHRAKRWKLNVANAQALEKAGVRFAFSSEGVSKNQDFHSQVRKLLDAGLSKDTALDALTRRGADIAGVGSRLGTLATGKLGHVVAWTGPFGEEKSKPRYVFIDGRKFDLEKPSASKAAAKKKGRRPDAAKDADKSDEPAKPDDPAASKKEAEKEQEKPQDASKADAAPAAEKPKAEEKPFIDVATEFDEDRKPAIHTGGNVLIKGATILTASKDRGTIPRGSILVKDGKIAAIGENLTAPDGAAVIDAAGLVAIPGIIDTHSHMAIEGGVNEMSLSVVPEVRVKDVVTGDDPNIYRALAGGTTAARLLHGSANTIGGQDAVVKLEPGQPGREMIIKTGPQGVKFALGENVTRSTGRFPNTRMGVEAVIERAFQEGRAYADAWKRHEAAKAKGSDEPPPRRDLRLEALAHVLDGSIKIHSHCYRSDEILMLLNVAERHGVRVRSLQHVLEGYKVAAEIAAHGASASTFSDWWAYKIEARDAIPYNAALLTRAGALVCIKSDSNELGRHLYLEAAKMLKYGGVTEEEALAMITLNPAKELGLEHRIGSLEVGKDADIALFNGHPFNAFARCELSLIDGEVWFQRMKKERPENGVAKVPSTLPRIDPASRDRSIAIAPSPRHVYALVGATVHPITGPEIADGTVVIAGGRIAAVGGPATPIPPLAQTVDLRGLDVWPGMIDAGSTIGLFEIGSLRETQDFADSAQFQPELLSSTALHPDSDVIPVTRANGVLTSFVQPTGGVIAGQGCLVTLDGWVPREMVFADQVALVVNIPAYVPPQEPGEPARRSFGPPDAASGDSDPRQRRRERLDEIEEQFRRAASYHAVKKEAVARSASPPAPDPRLDALAPYALGEKPVIFQAEHRTEILDALALAKKLKLKAVVSGARDAWKIADVIKASGVPVIIAGSLHVPSAPTEPYDAAYSNAARLFEAGITLAIRSRDGGATAATAPRNLPYEAATAVAYGLPEAAALEAVTINPAKILGVADQVGSIERGKRANVVVTAGHLLQPTTEVKALFLNGRPMTPENRQSQLYALYRKRLGEVRDGTAPLGIAARPTPVPAAGSNGGLEDKGSPTREEERR